MSIPLLKSNLALLEATRPESILAGWLKAVTNFHSSYHQLITCINQRMNEPELTLKNRVCIGQCPVNVLVELISLMRKELEKLNQDIDHPAQFNQLTVAENYKKLLNHTRVLNQLNQQAKNRLYLVGLPSS